MQYGFVIDHRKCIGCHACTVACKSENDVPVGSFRTWVKYTEIGSFPQVKRHFAVLRCNHCTDAPCVTICPVTALDKRADGIVDLDKDACIGCKACIQACPYDAIYLNEDTGGAEKCHFCAHRVEQSLKPACEVVCPEEAILSGDFHDPQSRVSQLVADVESVVRRPEQGTNPNVQYLGMDEVSLQPGLAQEPTTYLWSERRLPAPDLPVDFPVHPTARTVLDVDHDVHWGWRVSAYLVTKGIAAGAAILAPFVPSLGATGFAADILPEVVALAFTAITLVLLIADLKRPRYFFRLLTRPNTRSWLVKGGWVLTAFAAVTVAVLAARWLGRDGTAEALRWVNVPLGVLTAIYTAFLFAQCEGRDLWQTPGKVSVQLFAQALALGAAVLAPWLATAPGAGDLMFAVLVGMALHIGIAAKKQAGPHPTDNARQAAALLARVPVLPGGDLRALPVGQWLCVVAATLALVLRLSGAVNPGTGFVVLALAVLGLFVYEQAYLRAAQLPPLS